MNNINNKFAIGCLVQWYEIDIIEEYVDSLKQSLEQINNAENVMIHFTLTTNQDLEKIDKSQIDMKEIETRFKSMMSDKNWQFEITSELYTIADYRRWFNDCFCEKADVLIWGETDALLPKQLFIILDNLHDGVKDKTPKYTTFFGTCKMWDESWKILEHPEFTDKPFYSEPEDFIPDKHWWSNRYTMTIKEMNKFNDKVQELDVRILNQHKFNGCGLVISSEVIKAGVNIPRSVFFVHEDTSFMMMIQKVLGMIPQYVIKNILLVHNRNHPNKRMYVKNERIDGTMNEKRRSNDWYVKANHMSEQNCYNFFNPNFKSFTWEDVWK